ncbi:MAG: asparaginase [Paracoccaceae bacterium]
MTHPAILTEIWRGRFLESAHRGHAVVVDQGGDIVLEWGDPNAIVLPRSSAKMVQALPLITSGAANKYGLTPQHLALACASHNGAAIHTGPVQKWLSDLGLNDAALRCGPQMPKDNDATRDLIKSDASPCQYHNNCSGKHTGFLTLAQFLDAGPEYLEPDHPVQIAIKDAFEDATGEDSPGFGIDGCSAPNHATSLKGMARAMARFASAQPDSPEARLVAAMTTHPDLVAGEGRACTRLMRATGGKVALKTGAEAFFVAILPEQKLGVALKIEDGSTRAAECAIAAILVKLGALDPKHPDALAFTDAPITNWRGIETGHMRAADILR